MKSLNQFKSICFFLLFLNFYPIFTQEILIKNEETWYYYDKGPLNDDWVNEVDFIKWKTGTSPLGYGDDKNISELSYGEDKEQKHVTKYFAKKVFLKNTYLAYELKLQRDDGAVVYINGKELLRDNMPNNSSISFNTLSTSTIKGENEHKFYQHYFDNTILKEGENTIFVSVHQSNKSSSDCIFSLELLGHNSSEILSFVLENKNTKNNELENKIEILNLKFENEKILIKNESLQNIKFSLQILVFTLSIFLLMSLVGYYFILQNFKRKKEKIYKKSELLSIDNLKKDKEMISLSTKLLHHKQYFKEIKADLNSIKTDDKSIIKSIKNQIDYVLEKDEDWNILKQHFNSVFENFYDKLLEKHPTISESELRHCMFIKLHLQTKEIAKILLIDPRSVQTARYRIKKKMNLDEDKDLRDYLINI